MTRSIFFIILFFSVKVLGIDDSIKIEIHANNQLFSDERNSYFDSLDTYKGFIANKIKLRGSASASSDEIVLYSAEGSFDYEKNADGIVYVETEVGAGTGFVLEDGSVVTNWHVVNGSSFPPKVVFRPQSNVAVATRVHIADLIVINALADLALLKPRFPPDKIYPLKIASEKIFSPSIVTRKVHTIGFPEGGTHWHYNDGKINGIQKKTSWEYGDGTFHIADLILMDVEVNPGNSGGPLMFDDGTVIGVVVAGESAKIKGVVAEDGKIVGTAFGGSGLNKAIAVSTLTEFLNKKITKEPVRLKQEYKDAGYRIIKENNGCGDDNNFYYDELDIDLSPGYNNINNIKNLIRADLNCDYDWNVFLQDYDENNIWEKITIITSNKGNFYYLDGNQDSILDLRVIDHNSDGIDDEYFQIHREINPSSFPVFEEYKYIINSRI